MRRRAARGAAAIAAVLALVAPPATLAAAPTPSPPPTSDAWTISTVAGGAIPRDLGAPAGVTDDGAGNLFIVDGNPGGSLSDLRTHRILKGRVDGSGPLTVVAGTGEEGFGGDGGPALAAKFEYAEDVAWDAGSLYVADRYNHRIRRIDLATGTITSVVGSGNPDNINGNYSGDGGPATQAQIGQPFGVTFDRAHNLYIADNMNARVRKVRPGADGVVDGDEDETITTVAGNGNFAFGGDGGPASQASLRDVRDVAVDAGGNLYIADRGSNRVRMVDPSGTITTAAGGGGGGDGGEATAARLDGPIGVAVDAGRNLFIAEWGNNRIRRVDAAGVITTVAGTGEASYRGDGGPATMAALYGINKIHLDAAGNLFVAEATSRLVRRINTALVSMESTGLAPRVGTPFAYTIRVGALPAAATGLKLTLFLAPEVSYRRTLQGQCSMSKGVLACSIGSLARGATKTVVIEVMPTATRVTAEAPYVGLPVVSTAALSAKEAAAIPYRRTVTAHTKISAADCGQVITRSTTLTRKVGPCDGHGIVVGADGITVDLGEQTVFGFAGPSDAFVADPQRPFDDDSAGILLAPLQPGEFPEDITVTNGTVSHFDAGVAIFRGSRNTVRDLDVKDNVGPDRPFTATFGDGIVLWESSDNTVEANRLERNGVFDGIGVLGEFADHNRIRHNLVRQTLGPRDGRLPHGQGIIVNATSLNTDPARVGTLFIEGTEIIGNYVQGNAAAGIANVNSVCEAGQMCLIEANTVVDNGDTSRLPCERGEPGRDRCNRIANGIGVQLGPEAQPPAPYTNLVIRSNQVHGNAWHGIVIPGPSVPGTAHQGGVPTSSATGNQILLNDASDNAVDNNRSDLLTCEPVATAVGACLFLFDLYDGNPDCAGNTWLGNNWGSGGFSPPCTAAGGVGPPAPSGTSFPEALPMDYPASRAPVPVPE